MTVFVGPSTLASHLIFYYLKGYIMVNNTSSITKMAFKVGFGAYMGFQCAKFCDELLTTALRPAAKRLIDKFSDSLAAKKPAV